MNNRIYPRTQTFCLAAALSVFFSFASAQTNVFPSAGYVGLGTTTPIAPLHVTNGTSALAATVKVQCAEPTKFAAVDLVNDSGAAGLSITSYGSTYQSSSSVFRPNGASIHTTSSAGASAGMAIAARHSSGYITFHAGGDIERMRIKPDGNVGIGTSNPNEKLTVNGTIYGKEVRIDLSVPGPDYVFEKDYAIPSLDDLERFITANKHLPDVPSAKEMEEHGIKVGEMNMLLLKKIEELTLYLIKIKKKNDATEVRLLKKIEELELKISSKNNAGMRAITD